MAPASYEPLAMSVGPDDVHLLASVRAVLARWLDGARWPGEDAGRIVAATNEAVTAVALAARAGTRPGGDPDSAPDADPATIRIDGTVLRTASGEAVEVRVTHERAVPRPGTPVEELTVTGPPPPGPDHDVLAVLVALVPTVVRRRTVHGDALVLRSAPVRR